MNKAFVGWLMIGLLLAVTRPAHAQEQPRDIVEKAIKAQGSPDRIAKCKAFRMKSKGKLEMMGGLPFTSELTVTPSGQMKEDTDIEINGQKTAVTTVFNGTKAWIKAGGQTIDMDQKMVGAMKEAVYQFRVGLLVELKDPKYELSSLGETKVDGRPVLGIKVSSKGHKDISLYFDKANSLLVRTDSRTLDFATGMEVAEETIVSGYQEMDGVKTPKKIRTQRDGQKYLEAEITDLKLLDKEPDESEFAKP
jgi:hypothetical protein